MPVAATVPTVEGEQLGNAHAPLPPTPPPPHTLHLLIPLSAALLNTKGMLLGEDKTISGCFSTRDHVTPHLKPACFNKSVHGKKNAPHHDQGQSSETNAGGGAISVASLPCKAAQEGSGQLRNPAL